MDLFKKYGSNGDDPDVKQFAEEQTLPTIQHHLDEAKKLPVWPTRRLDHVGVPNDERSEGDQKADLQWNKRAEWHELCSRRGSVFPTGIPYCVFSVVVCKQFGSSRIPPVNKERRDGHPSDLNVFCAADVICT